MPVILDSRLDNFPCLLFINALSKLGESYVESVSDVLRERSLLEILEIALQLSKRAASDDNTISAFIIQL